MTKQEVSKFIERVYSDICSRPHGNCTFIRYDGFDETTDVGYAFDGIDLFKEELLIRLGELPNN